MVDMPSELEIETYMRGECHIHALASIRQHGGHLAICYDDSEIYFEDENGDTVSSVIHVWSVHQTPVGPIARDVLGDIPFTPDAMIESLDDFFPGMEQKFRFGDAWIDREGTLQEIEDLSGDEEHQPLFSIREEDIEIALTLPSVRQAPGTRPPDPPIERRADDCEI